jgi:hypothetical protein
VKIMQNEQNKTLPAICLFPIVSSLGFERNVMAHSEYA